MLPIPVAHGGKSTGPPARVWLGRPLLRWLAFLSTLAIIVFFFGSGIVDQYEYLRKPNLPPGGLVDVLKPPKPPSLPDAGSTLSSSAWDQRAALVRDAYKFAYGSYMEHAAGYDELLPVSLGHKNNFNGWGVSMVDSLDTMWIMGLHDEFEGAMQAVANLTFSLSPHSHAPFFETVIRYLGGLLSAYALSGETLLLSRAEELGRKLLPVFNTTSGLPWFGVNTVTGQTSYGWTGGQVLFAEAATCQMEYKYLAHLTGRPEFYNNVEKIMEVFYNFDAPDGLLAERWGPENGLPFDHHYTVGASADSGYEYFLKQYLLSGKSEPKARDQYIKSANGIISNLLFLSPTRKLLYVTDTYPSYVFAPATNTSVPTRRPSHSLEHLSCFLPGLLALGVHTLGDALSARERQLHKWAAEGLAHTCWTTYADMKSGLGPDSVRFNENGTEWMKSVEEWEEGRKTGGDGGGGVPPGLSEPPPVMLEEGERDYVVSSQSYLLRPETIETLFIMWKTTGDIKWRERGWAVFEALEKNAKNKHGYATVHHVDMVPTYLLDDMPSFFLAETLKYLYLLFVDHDVIPLDKWVFNTEAHPLPIFHWKDWEKTAYSLHST